MKVKEHYREAMHCVMDAVENCAIAVAIADFFHDAQVFNKFIYTCGGSVSLPEEASSMIYRFDESTPEERLLLPEFSFIIEVPETVINEIGISQVYKILSESSNLELAV